MTISPPKVTVEISIEDLTLIRRAIECCLKQTTPTDASNVVIGTNNQEALRKTVQTIRKYNY